MPLSFLIAYAHKLPTNPNARLTGMPDWAPQAIYDVEATSAMPAGLSIQARDERVRLMVQALLADRFRMAIHRESKEMAVFASAPVPDVCHAFNGGQGRGLHARAVNMSDLASWVENWTDRVYVIDHVEKPTED